MTKRPIFSIVHASARPAKWFESWCTWTRHAWNRFCFEYLLVADERQEKEFIRSLQNPPQNWGWPKLLINRARECCVDAYNVGAAHSTGDVLILNSDDMFPPEQWDVLLAKVIGDRWKEEFVVRCATGHPSRIDLQIFSRKRYLRLGYALYPEYLSMNADNEFTFHAEMDGCVVEAPDVIVSHRHPHYAGGWPMDEVYQREMAPDRHVQGMELLLKRKAQGFPPPTTPPGRPETLQDASEGKGWGFGTSLESGSR